MYCNYEITKADAVGYFPICRYFNPSCLHPVPLPRHTCLEKEMDSEQRRILKNQRGEFKTNHDANSDCARALEDMRSFARANELAGKEPMLTTLELGIPCPYSEMDSRSVRVRGQSRLEDYFSVIRT